MWEEAPLGPEAFCKARMRPRVSGFGFRFSVFVFRVLSLGFRFSFFGFRYSVFGFGFSGNEVEMPRGLDRGTSLIRNTHPPRITVGPYA